MKSEARAAGSLPIQLHLRDRTVLVAGGGAAAVRLIFRLLRCGAKVIAIAPKADRELQMLAADREIRWIKRTPRLEHLKGVDLLFTATGSRLEDGRAARLARRKKVWVGTCRFDRECDLHLAEFFRRGALTCSMSGPDELPWLDRYLIRRMQRAFGPEWAALVEVLRRWKHRGLQRPEVQKLLMRGIPRWLRDAKKNRLAKVRREMQRLMR